MPKTSITNFLSTWRQGRLMITPRVSYNMRDVLEDITRIRHAQFLDPNFSDGTPKVFYNIGWAMIDNIYKHTLIGTKDLQLTSDNRIGARILPLIKMGVKDYLKDTIFGQIADEARMELIAMGHVITKIVDNIPYTVDPLMIILPPNNNSLQDGSLVEQINLTWEQVSERKDQYKDHWQEIKDVWEFAQKAGRNYITIYEYWTRDDFDGEYTKGCLTYLDRSYIPEDQINDPSIWSPYLEIDKYKSPFSKKIRSRKRRKELGKDEEIAYPYEEKRLFHLKGRYWGLGVIELIMGVLEHINKNWNLKNRFDDLQFRGITVHRQPSSGEERSITQEFLEKLTSGAVIDLKNDEDIHRLDLGTITAEHLNTNEALMQLVKFILGIAEQIATNQMKPGITATAINANANLAETTYGLVIRQMSFLLREMFEDFILKEILEEMTMEDWIAVTGDPKELLAVEEPLMHSYINESIYRYAENQINISIKSGHIITEQELNQFVETLEKDSTILAEELKKELGVTGEMRWAQLQKELIKQAKLGVEFYIDKDNFDPQQRVDTIEGILNRPSGTSLNKEELELEELSLIGLDEQRYRKTEEQKQQEAQQQAMMMQMPNPRQKVQQ